MPGISSPPLKQLPRQFLKNFIHHDQELVFRCHYDETCHKTFYTTASGLRDPYIWTDPKSQMILELDLPLIT